MPNTETAAHSGMGRVPSTTPEDVLEVFHDREDRAEPLTAPELAEELDCSRRTALNKLSALEDREDVKIASKKVGGRSKVWWLPLVDHEPREPRERREPASTPAPVDDDQPATDDADDAEPTSEDVHAVVDDVAASWDDDDRLEDRKAAARAVLEHALESGEHISKGDAVERFHNEHAVDGQSTETWWRQNVRPVLRAVGEHSRGRGYRVDPDAVVQ